MAETIYTSPYDLEYQDLHIDYYTYDQNFTVKYFPSHWHSALELIYILNGTGEITIDGHKHLLVAGEFILIDSNQIHETQCTQSSMGIYVHISRQYLKKYMEQLDFLHLQCSRGTLKREQLEYYLQISSLFRKLAPLYVQQPLGYQLKSHAIAMNIIFLLITHFSYTDSGSMVPNHNLERLSEITSYIQLHYQEAMPLQEIASHFGLSREYFCRFFSQNMGVSFTRYLNLARLVHIYQDLCHTQDSILALIEKHGFTNYKLFNKMFHEIYGCTPRSIRSSISQRIPKP